MKPVFVSDRVDVLDERMRAVIAECAADDREIASIQARKARRLARLVELAEERAELLAGALTGSVREWARRSLQAEIACATRQAERTTGRLIADAEALVTDLPATLRALEAGEVSYQHARSMVVHASTLPTEVRGSFEEAILPRATTVNPARFDDAARRFRETHHPESIIQRAKDAREERAVWLDPERDGMATLHHHLPAVDALAIHDALDQAARARRSDTEPRTQAQLRSDILADTLLGRSDCASLGFTPTVIVTVPAAIVAGIDDRPADGQAELHGYGPIDPELARRITAHAPTLLRVLVEPATHDTLEVAGRYRIPTVLRETLIVADEHCRFPGCGRRAARCELDHTKDWAHGGRSTATNLAHLCSRHHHLKHDGGWQVRRPPGSPPKSRELEWTSPLGATYRTVPPARLAHETPPI